MEISLPALQLNFRTDLANKLVETQMALELIASSLSKLGLEADEPISFGSRVLVTYEGNTGTAEGRVWGIKPSGTIVVNRDGYKSVMNFEPSSVKNLSVGTYGRLERKQWLLKRDVIAFQTVLQDSGMPRVFTELKDNIIHVVQIDNCSYCQMVDFVHASNLKSYRLKLPLNTVASKGYYHIICSATDIESLYASDKFAFEKFYDKPPLVVK
ncbi:hypothetical protein ACFP2F_07740 [Hymenobacter artigasi]|uniref:Uncharacterized protein n=1 Tax=Hymenobacter artigasi TaxID=2719616 RepID=A0ABX1HFX2_9BACT|nr:hypothetical protein [Hymenobacter artigasi]NKI89143.1 hypothetical protein [Hymenobacter artigasi]